MQFRGKNLEITKDHLWESDWKIASEFQTELKFDQEITEVLLFKMSYHSFHETYYMSNTNRTMSGVEKRDLH